MKQGKSPIAEVLQPYVDECDIAGAVTLVADRTGVLDLTAVGSADLEAGRRMETNAIFWIASQTKSLTAAALMILVDEHSVLLDDPVEKYLPQFANQWVISERDENRVVLVKPKHPITVRNILSHTSGLPFQSKLEECKADRFPLEARVASYALMLLLNQPNAKYRYSGAGMNTAGHIIETVSGMSYEDFLEERLLGPLGMTDTTFWPDSGQKARMPKMYQANVDGDAYEEIGLEMFQSPLDNRQRRHVVPSGGIFSTATDISRFCRMILGEGTLDGRRYLSKDAVYEMTRKQTGDLPDSYGLGWAVGDGWCGHGGFYSTNMTVDFGSGLVMIYCVHHKNFLRDGEQSFNQFEQTARAFYGHREHGH